MPMTPPTSRYTATGGIDCSRPSTLTLPTMPHHDVQRYGRTAETFRDTQAHQHCAYSTGTLRIPLGSEADWSLPKLAVMTYAVGQAAAHTEISPFCSVVSG